MAVPVINLTHEGFGRALITVGRLVVVNKLCVMSTVLVLRVRKMHEEAEQLIKTAVQLIRQYPEVAKL
jgi:probable nitrogen fixation protein